MRFYIGGIILICTLPVFAQDTILSEALVLTPQLVVDRVLADGFDNKYFQLDRIIASKDYYDAKGYFDFGFEAKAEYEQVNIVPLGPFENEKEDTYAFSSKLLKPMGLGSTVSLEYERTSLQRKLNSFLSNNNSLSTQTTDFVHLELQQNLWNNFAGGIYDRRLKMQKLLETKRNEDLLESTEELIVNGLDQFWKTYAASENLKAAIDTRDRYKKLVSTSQRKKRLGFAAPGELARVEAEFEQKDQNVKRLSSEYLTELDNMFLLLGVESPEQVDFSVDGQEIPDLPDFKKVDLENIRQYKIQKIATQSKEMNKKIVDSEQTPKLDVIARLSYRGADERASETFSDLSGLDSPIYFVGVTFQTYLGSSSQMGAKQKARAEYEKELLALEKSRMEINDFILKAQRQVSAYYKIAQSAKTTVELRTQALKEIESAYGQGRLDVSHVIEAFNLLLTAKTEFTRSVGNYHIWRNHLASATDQLIQQFVGKKKEM